MSKTNKNMNIGLCSCCGITSSNCDVRSDAQLGNMKNCSKYLSTMKFQQQQKLRHQSFNQSESTKNSTIVTSPRRTLLRHKTRPFFKHSNLLKGFLLAHIFILIVQVNLCESSAKWWSIVNIPTTESSDTTQRQIRRVPSSDSRLQASNNNIYNSYQEGDDDLLSNEKIREILSSNQNKRDVTNTRFDDVTRLTSSSTRRRPQPNNRYEGGLIANMRPSVLVDQRVQLLSRKQRRILRRNPGALFEIIRGLKRAVRECKFQFRNRKWTCPTNSRDSSLFGKVLDRGFKETAFIHAITSAAVSYAIASACGRGAMETCGCYEKRGEGGPGWEWGGCSDNFKFGRKFAKEFVDADENGKDLKYRMNLHNNEAGRQTVNEQGVRACKCHGMSGSCTVKTCWLRTANFRAVARSLREKYDAAEEVQTSNTGIIQGKDRGLIPAILGRKPPKKQDLVYFEHSPNYCIKNSEFWVEGTRGRTCNATSSGYNGCDSMCCGRGFKTRTRIIKQNCKCKFEWCCHVRCETCEIKKVISVCK